jgi:hypothetical protein
MSTQPLGSVPTEVFESVQQPVKKVINAKNANPLIASVFKLKNQLAKSWVGARHGNFMKEVYAREVGIVI